MCVCVCVLKKLGSKCGRELEIEKTGKSVCTFVNRSAIRHKRAAHRATGGNKKGGLFFFSLLFPMMTSTKEPASAAFRIRRLTSADEVNAIMATWAKREGWAPGAADYIPFFAADKDGFFVGEVPEEEFFAAGGDAAAGGGGAAAGGGGDAAATASSGKFVPVSSVSAVRYGDGFGFVGLYVCEPSQRGKGYGLAVFKAGMAHLEGRCAGLDGVRQQESNYAKMGFKTVFRHGRYALQPSQVVAALADASSRQRQQQIKFVRVRDLDAAGEGVSAAALEQYDQEHSGFLRPAFLRAFVSQPDYVAFVAVQTAEPGAGAGDAAAAEEREEKASGRPNAKIVGLGAVRPCAGGYRVGPLFAQTTDVAAGLLSTLASASTALAAATASDAASSPSEPTVWVDVPDNNAAALQLIETVGGKFIFDTARMYTLEESRHPKVKTGEVFAPFSLEVG